MIIQEIGSEIISQIKSEMERYLNKSVQGLGLGIKTPKGEVVTASANSGGERKYIGISDNIGTFFYIRYDGKVMSRRLSKGEKVGSCNEVMMTAPMRLVFIDHCLDPQKLLLLVQNSLSGICFSGFKWQHGQKKVEIWEKSCNFIAWDIFAEETGKPKNEFQSSAIQIVSIDFDIKLITNYNFCSVNKCD